MRSTKSKSAFTPGSRSPRMDATCVAAYDPASRFSQPDRAARLPAGRRFYVKRAYFHLLTADNDDLDLGAAKVMGHVPETCLLGGVHAWQAIDAGRDPCATCLAPRGRCGGRPKVDLYEERFPGADLLRDLHEKLRD